MESQLEEIIRLTVQLKTAQAPHHGTLTDWARGQQAKLQAAAAGAGGDAAARARVHGGVTQLTAAGGAARTAMYQETHVQVWGDCWCMSPECLSHAGYGCLLLAPSCAMRGATCSATVPDVLHRGMRRMLAG